jgi:acetyl esterase/lipase
MYDRLPSWVARSAYLVLVLLLSLTAPVQAQEQVRYGDASVQVADLYAAGDGAPVLVLLTGGGWIRDDTALAGPWASTVQAAGVTVLVPHYTLGAPDVAEADIVQAVSFAAQLPGRGRLTLAGHSAGAHLAAMVGVDQPRNLDGLLLLSGIYDLPGAVQDGGMGAWLVQQAFGDDRVAWQAQSPLVRVHAAAPPTWLVHGATDQQVSPERATAFATRLREAGTPIALSLLRDADHMEIPFVVLFQYRQQLLHFLSAGQLPAGS